MSRKNILLIPMLCLSFMSMGQNKNVDAAKQVIQDCFDSIWSDLDTSKITLYHTKDYLLIENGELWNNDSVANYQTKALYRLNRPTRINNFEFVRHEEAKNTVFLAYHNYATIKKGEEVLGKMHWLESALLVKEKDVWKIKVLHSTPVK